MIGAADGVAIVLVAGFYGLGYPVQIKRINRLLFFVTVALSKQRTACLLALKRPT